MSALSAALADRLGEAANLTAKLIKQPHTLSESRSEVEFKTLLKGLCDARGGDELLIEDFDDEQIWAQVEDAVGGVSWSKEVKRVGKVLDAEAEEESAPSEVGSVGEEEDLSLASGSDDEDGGEEEEEGENDDDDDASSLAEEEEEAVKSSKPQTAPVASKKTKSVVPPVDPTDALLAGILESEQTKQDRKNLRNEKKKVQLSLDMEDSEEEEGGEDVDLDAKMGIRKKPETASSAGAAADKNADIKKKKKCKGVKKGDNDAGPKHFGEMADTDSEEEAGPTPGKSRFAPTEVDDEFFSLREMEKFGEEAEQLAAMGEADGGDEDDDDEIYKMFFSDDVGDGGDLMYDDFFAPASGKKKNTGLVSPSDVDASAAVAAIVGGGKTAEKKSKESRKSKKETLLPPASDASSGEEEEDSEEDMASDLEDKDDAPAEIEDDAARRKRRLAAMEADGESEDEEEDSEDEDDEEGSTKLMGGKDHDVDSESESEASTCSWESEVGDRSLCFPGSGGLDSEGEEDEVDLDALDAEDRALELTLRKLGRGKQYMPGGEISKDFLNRDSDSESDAEGDDEDVDSDDSDARVNPKRNLVKTLTDKTGGKKKDGGGNKSGKKIREDESAGSENDSEEDNDSSDDEDEDSEGTSGKVSSLVIKDRRLAEQEAECERMEQELLGKKHWSLTGEATARDRERNSLLEMHLDLPMTHTQSKRAVDDAIAAGQEVEEASDAEDNAGEKLKFDIEAITRRRIADGLFDDVVRKADTRPANKKDGEDETAEVLNFQKSRVGLADIYAQQYEEEVFGKASKEEEKESKEKLVCRELFGQLMFKLDQLTNAHFVPKPVAIGGVNTVVSNVELEEAVPTTMSAATRKAPEEIRAHEKHTRDHTELEGDELAAARRRRKTQRKKNIEGKLAEGEMSLKDVKERQEKLDAKNKIAREKKEAKGKPKDRVKKQKNAELLAKAAALVEERASGGAGESRKRKLKEWKERGEGGGEGRKEAKQRRLKF